MACEFKLRRQVEFSDTDMAGIMHFSNFFRFMEAAEHAFFRSLGFSIHTAPSSPEPGQGRTHECEPGTLEIVDPFLFESKRHALKKLFQTSEV